MIPFGKGLYFWVKVLKEVEKLKIKNKKIPFVNITCLMNSKF